MAIEIRDFDAATDAEQVAQLFNSVGYGPMETGKRLTPESLIATMESRETRLFLVAVNGDRVVGTSGYARMSRRRVAPEGQLYAGMFLIDPSMRAGLLAGRLFLESFEWAVRAGVRTLRVEVDPSNRRALPIYVRGGFRSVSDAAPDEAGFIELVSHLPGVTSDLRSAYPEDAPARDGWRAIRSRRQDSTATGVRRAEDEADWTVDYTFDVRDTSVVATVGAHDGVLHRVTIDGVTQAGFGEKPTRPSFDSQPPRERRLGEFVVRLDRDGQLTIHHPGHLGPVFSDPFPVLDGTPAGGWRPAVTRVVNTDTSTGWQTTSDELTRSVSFDDHALAITVHGPSERTITAYPISGVRIAEVSALTADGKVELAHAVLGEWPPDMPGFAPAGEPTPKWQANGLQVGWVDRELGTGFRIVCISAERARMDGQHAVVLLGSGVISYTVAPQAGFPAVESANTGSRTDADESGHVRWRQTTSRQEPDLVAERLDGSASIVVSTSGVVEWTRASDTILEAASLRRRTFGPFDELPASIWVAGQSDRSVGGGAGWSLQDPQLPFLTDFDGDRDGWTLVPSDEFDALDVVVRATAHTAPEAAVYLRAGDRESPVEIMDSGRGWRRIGPSRGRWRTWTRSARLAVGNGWLEVASIAGRHPEILVRSTSAGVLLTMFARTQTPHNQPVRWRISHSEHTDIRREQ
ncbi:GNAT family N-acetyltransferase [Leifsonia sp. McL0607]|uniref:GNAT family N-acetyltransferase n=1 Tax=Leifsonia sp. McL0607 TaxID=3415672 RepID=UPI003CFB7FDF